LAACLEPPNTCVLTPLREGLRFVRNAAEKHEPLETVHNAKRRICGSWKGLQISPRGKPAGAVPRSSPRAEFSASCHSAATASQSRFATGSGVAFAFRSASSAKCANSSDFDNARVPLGRFALACLGDETKRWGNAPLAAKIGIELSPSRDWLTMPGQSFTLSEYPFDWIELTCDVCDRRGLLRKARGS
jgi:hypothetical protein